MVILIAIPLVGAVAHMEHQVLLRSSPEAYFNALELLLNANMGQAVVFEAKMSKLSSLLPPSGQSYLRDLVINEADGTEERKSENNVTSNDSISRQFWMATEEMTDDMLSFVGAELSKIIRSMLKHDTNEAVDSHETFAEVGLDSLMIFEFKNSVQNLVGSEVEISVDSISNNNSVNALAKYILATRSSGK